MNVAAQIPLGMIGTANPKGARATMNYDNFLRALCPDLIRKGSLDFTPSRTVLERAIKPCEDHGALQRDQ